ncbi:hypothetical protein BCV72DRAFT_249698 [Rhizopus microsporus var. microsporus]|uniref:Zn(2)-C6 fungal-type domain-containing protein n=1 Tax=Rhizopus microsporus var. microsporus TaxID=86635 RepID=A0A1X0R4Q9_RHIZD|nr:hypothetical protein BCV72DRAFT_249698 [Rhizopus microsporus var. microsporus]
MTGTFRWHSCSTSDFPLKRHKVKNPCQRCESNKATCTYSDKPTRPRSKSNRHQVMLDKLQFLDDHYRTKNYRTSCPLLFLDIFHIPTYSIDITSIALEHKLDSVLHDSWVKDAVQQFVTHHLLYGPWIDVHVLAIMLYPLDENYARLFYREAHRHFIDSCFPILDQKEQNQHLIEAACMAISEEQAFMTIRLGLDLAQSKGNLNGALLRTLDAWYIWLTVHLRRPYFGELDASMKPTGLNDNQLWAFEMTEAYTDFLKRIILERRSTDLKLIQVKLKSNKDSLDSIIKPKRQPCNTLEILEQAVLLYHHMLIIQLYSTIDDEEDICSEICLDMLKLIHQILSRTDTKCVPFAVLHSVCFLFTCVSNKRCPELLTQFIQLLKEFSYINVFEKTLDKLLVQDMDLPHNEAPSPCAKEAIKNKRPISDFDREQLDKLHRGAEEHQQHMQQIQQQQQQQQQYLFSNTEDAALMYDIFMVDNPPFYEDKKDELLYQTKLPLPQPTKQASVLKTSWAAPSASTQRPWSKFFLESEVQTLHYQTSSLDDALIQQSKKAAALIHHQRQPSFSDSNSSSTTSPNSTNSHYSKRQHSSRQSSVDAMAAAVWVTGFPGTCR